jgi:choice-of-anchor B domain-containing protein
MKIFLIVTTVLITAISTHAQTNIEFMSQLPYESKVSDIWGHVDSTGIEYALVGVNSGGTSVVSLEDPFNPIEVYFAPGVSTIWRDIKTWKNHSYTVNDNGGGALQILDLSSLPDTSGVKEYQYFTDWTTAHNIFIDKKGFAYIFGANRGTGGVIILDLADPKNPVEIGVFDDYYVHDGMALGDTLYLAHILNGFFSMVDISDPGNPVLLVTYNTPRNFTHNIWVADDAQHLYTTDERSGAWLASYDISDLDNIFETDRIRSLRSDGNPVIIHNTHFLNNYLITSYYTDGITIHDATRPHNLVEVGHYDTSPLTGSGYNGSWGVYPYLPSGLLLVSDIEEGLFVLNPTYKRAGSIEGIITDVETGLPIQEVSVEIEPNTKEETSLSDGSYATGVANGGVYEIRYSKPGYYPFVTNVNLVNNQVYNLDVQLLKDIRFTIKGKVESLTGFVLGSVPVHIVTAGLDTSVLTNGIGDFELKEAINGDYEIQVQKWGLVSTCFKDSMSETHNNYVNIDAKLGYQDDFSSDMGWTVMSNASSGVWERGEPNAAEPGEPMGDSNDCFNFAFYTKTGDVQNGWTELSSPIFDATTLFNPIVTYSYYWSNNSLSPTDFAQIRISNGIETVLVQRITNLNTNNNVWLTNSINILDFLTVTDQMQLTVLVNNDVGLFNSNIEMTFDNFNVDSSSINNVDNTSSSNNSWQLFPNPSNSYVEIFGTTGVDEFEVINMSGQVVKAGPIKNNSIQTSDLGAGIYMIRIGTTSRRLMIQK